jgi:hypothetical protein
VCAAARPLRRARILQAIHYENICTGNIPWTKSAPKTS